LVDLASYIHLALRAFGVKKMSSLAKKIPFDGAVAGCTHGTILVEWAQGRAGVTGIFVIVESGVFVQFNLRRQA